MKTSLAVLCFSLVVSVVPAAAQEEAVKSRGNTFNPDMSLNGLFLYRNGTRGQDPTETTGPKNGFSVEEAELMLTADVDPYMRAVGLLALAEEPTGWVLEPEELYGETLGLSLVTLKFGKFKTLINKHNVMHAHVYPFLDQPLVNQELLGDEGLNETGLSLAALLPTPWFMELTLQMLNGEHAVFASPSTNDNAGIAYLDNLFDLSETLTLQIGGSATQGQNSTDGITRIGAGDLTVKWKPIGNDSVRTLKWATHYMTGYQSQSPALDKFKQGITSYIQWQGGNRWWLQARTEYYDERDAGDLVGVKRKNSALYAFIPSEFSALRFQLDQLEDGADPVDRRFLVQLNWSIGAHPAHQY